MTLINPPLINHWSHENDDGRDVGSRWTHSINVTPLSWHDIIAIIILLNVPLSLSLAPPVLAQWSARSVAISRPLSETFSAPSAPIPGWPRFSSNSTLTCQPSFQIFFYRTQVDNLYLNLYPLIAIQYGRIPNLTFIVFNS